MEKIQYLHSLDHFGLIRADIEKKKNKYCFIPKIVTWAIGEFRELRKCILTQIVFFFCFFYFSGNGSVEVGRV